MTLELNATAEDVMRAVETLQEFGRAKNVPEKALFGLALALEESASNIVNHGLQRDPSQRFQVLLHHTGGAVIIELRDRGPAFDPTQAPPPPDAASEEERAPGGWGLQLVRHYMDEVRYARLAGENILRLTKRLRPEPTQPDLPEPNQTPDSTKQ